MRITLYFISFTLVFFSFQSAHSSERRDYREVLRTLDSNIEKVDEYREKKEKKIDFLKNIFYKTKDLDHKFELSSDIFEEYKVFQFDSAYVYAKISRKLAFESGNINFITAAKSQQLFCFTSKGYFKEGAELIKEFSPTGVNNNVLADFYINCYLFYHNLRQFVMSSKPLMETYRETQKKYLDLALNLLKNDNFTTQFYKIRDSIFNETIANSTIDDLKSLLATENISDHNRAIIYSLLGISFKTLGDNDSAIYYTALSAICDTENAIYETTATKMLADYMVETDDIERASKYINHAWKDANTYNTHLRKLEIQLILPYIESLKFNGVDKQRRNLLLFSLVIVILLVLVLVMFVNIRMKNFSLRIARKELENRTQELVNSNSELSLINSELHESNRIKDSYIIESLYDDSGFVDRVEKSYKIFERKIRAKQYSDLHSIMKDIDIKRERARMSSSFDSAFIKLFPQFVDQYNKLFSEENRVVLNESNILTPEMRIFALIKLGIDDINKISKYLNLSVNTIYVYKAKVKSKTIVPKDEFEEYIKRI